MVISEETRARIAAEQSRYPQPRGALLPALHLVQRELGHIAPETAREVAELFDLQPVDVMEVVTFYNMFYASPGGRHHAYVCTN
ncbi:MAG: NADH-quinone oxidoreductase subunit NuoE, partial [Gammaproteobacteria bacterium]|nr:NADH-quinone oxidoreductase subunit NuoE [Gammaproteobacteria bacterium]